MIAVDSSVLVRYLAQDDPDQGHIAASFMEELLSADAPGYISIVVLIETIWVLPRTHRLEDVHIAAAIQDLISASQFRVEGRGVVEQVLRSGSRDLPDRIIHELGRRAGCNETVTFDRRYARIEGVRLLTG